MTTKTKEPFAGLVMVPRKVREAEQKADEAPRLAMAVPQPPCSAVSNARCPSLNCGSAPAVTDPQLRQGVLIVLTGGLREPRRGMSCAVRYLFDYWSSHQC